MTLKVEYADVVLGEETTRYSMDNENVDDIGLDPQTLALVVKKKDGVIVSFFGCPYKICQRETPDIIMPDLNLSKTVGVS